LWWFAAAARVEDVAEAGTAIAAACGVKNVAAARTVEVVAAACGVKDVAVAGTVEDVAASVKDVPAFDIVKDVVVLKKNSKEPFVVEARSR
jgi:uncharacterized protein YunC (DUF1805 family)